MHVESIPLADLHEDPDNARKHGRRNLDAIKDSLSRFGQQKPIVVDADGRVVAGNGTFAAAQALGWTSLDCVCTKLRGADAKAYAVSDNRAAELAEWDADVLLETLTLPDIGDLAFSDAEMSALAEIQATEPDTLPPPEPRRATSDDGPKSGASIKLTAEQRAGADEVFARFRDLHGQDGPALSEGQICTLIFADWVAGN